MTKPREKPVWPWTMAVALGLPGLYVASFAPTCWFTSRMKWHCGDELGILYRPLLWLWEQDHRVAPALDRYSSVGAAPNWNWLGDNWSD